MGCALQVKLTAGVVIPAAIALIVINRRTGDRPSRPWQSFQLLLVWLCGACASFFLIALLSAGETAHSLMSSHFDVHGQRMWKDANAYSFSLLELLHHPEALAGALLGICVIGRRRQWTEAAFPLILLLTTLGIHIVHRPYWPYYYLHILIPLSWLSGHAFSVARGPLTALALHRSTGAGLAKGIRCLSFACLILLAWAGGHRLFDTLGLLSGQPSVQEVPMLSAIRQNCQRTHWFYTEEPILAFHARVRVPPELAVLPMNRFWSGQITQAGIVAITKKYMPEQLLLYAENADSEEWRQLLASKYFLAYDGGYRRLYVVASLRTNNSGSSH